MGVTFVRKITTLLVIGGISKVKKNRYGHIDRGFLRLKVNTHEGLNKSGRGLASAHPIQAAAGASPSS
jgi:hypothetical protein